MSGQEIRNDLKHIIDSIGPESPLVKATVAAEQFRLAQSQTTIPLICLIATHHLVLLGEIAVQLANLNEKLDTGIEVCQ